MLSADQGAAKLLDISYLPPPQQTSFTGTMAGLLSHCRNCLSGGIIAPALSSQFQAVQHISLPQAPAASPGTSILQPQVKALNLEA